MPFVITEVLPAAEPGWDLAGIGCTDQAGIPADLLLDIAQRSISATPTADHVLRCTFTNNQQAGLTAAKIVDGVANGAQWGPFDLTLSSSDGGLFNGAATQSVTGTGPGANVAGGWTGLVAAKHYTLAETPVAGWNSSLTCAGLVDLDPTTAGFQFVATAGQSLVCTATNEAAPASVTLTKNVTGIGPNRPWSFDFTLSPTSGVTGSSPQTISGTGPANGAGPVGWTGLTPGTQYSIVESPNSLYTETLTCTGATDIDTATPGFQFIAQPNQQMTCSATNQWNYVVPPIAIGTTPSTPSSSAVPTTAPSPQTTGPVATTTPSGTSTPQGATPGSSTTAPPPGQVGNNNGRQAPAAANRGGLARTGTPLDPGVTVSLAVVLIAAGACVLTARRRLSS